MTTSKTPPAVAANPLRISLRNGQQGRLFQGDCLHILPTFPDHSVGLVVTDPPYGVNYVDRCGRTVANDDQLDWIEPAFAEIARLLKPNRFCVSFLGWFEAERFFSAWKRCGLSVVGNIVFSKRYASSQRSLAWHHESAMLLSKGYPTMTGPPLRSVQPWKYTGNRCHPTQKPVSAMERLISAFGQPGEIVLDPFMGSGSTLLAAADLEYPFIGIELDRKCFEMASGRVQSFVRAEEVVSTC